MTHLEFVGVVCLTLAVILEPASYYRQIRKTLRTKKSSQVSSTSFVYRLCKHILAAVGLAIFINWVGFWMQIIGLIFGLAAFIVVIRYKPKGWRLF